MGGARRPPGPHLGSHAGVSIDLSPEMQAIGTYPIGIHGSVGIVATEWGGGSMAAPYQGGTVQITAIDDVHVAFTLSGTDPFFLHDQNVDGSFVAARCP